MKTWQKATFIIVLVVFIAASVTISFISMARAPFEYEYQTEIAEFSGNEGWVLFGFNGNNSTKEVHIDYVRDEDGNNPDTSKPVSAVGKFTMNTDEYVEVIHIGKDVKYIDETSFFYCKELKAIEVDNENEFYTSVDGVLYTKDMKKLLVYPIMKENESGKYAIPEGVERIGKCAFYKNEAVTEITLPSTLKEIGDMAFFKCENIGLVTLPDGLVKIGSDAFSYCQGMKHVMYIPASVKEIGSFAFYSCSNLKEFYMGAQNENEIVFGDTWLPKNIKKVVVNVAPKEQYGKTRDDANQRINELIAEGGEK
ncbi:MAG: leucine-rich repeat domain-containing protein [Clostridia bacterium]|nr:leucine-rich repeat domain-containing protein [Clostridia bacterium]